MTTEFDDELLSAVLDGEADPQTVAAVRADAEASARLRSMEAAAALVATPIAPATPERRAASIAAALAAAPASPEVSSLSVARERKVAATPKRRQVNWLAVAAAFAVVLLSATVLVRTIGSDSADTTDTATDAVDAAADAAEDVVDDAADGSFGGDTLSDVDAGASIAEAEIMADDAMDDSAEMAMDDEDAMEDDDAMEDTAPAPTTTTVATRLQPFSSNSVLALEEAIESGLITPTLRTTDLALLDDISPDCIPADVDPVAEIFALAELGDFAPPPRLVIVQFDPDEVIIFNAEDCTPVG